MRTRLCCLMLLVLLAVMLAPGAVLAQDAAEMAADTASDGPRSFAAAFFISRKADGSVEWLGSGIIWLLLFLSAFSVGLIGSVGLTNQRKHILPPEAIIEVKRLMKAGRFRETIELTARGGSFFTEILHPALCEAGHGFAAVLRSLEQTADELTTIRQRRIEYLNVLGQVSPMIGLFGTVYGMILAFQAIVVSGGNADPILLAGGIGTALTTTFWGLVVAIPALSGFAIIRSRIDELTTEATLAAEELINEFRPRPDAKKTAAAKGKPEGAGA